MKVKPESCILTGKEFFLRWQNSMSNGLVQIIILGPNLHWQILIILCFFKTRNYRDRSYNFHFECMVKTHSQFSNSFLFYYTKGGAICLVVHQMLKYHFSPSYSPSSHPMANKWLQIWELRWAPNHWGNGSQYLFTSIWKQTDTIWVKASNEDLCSASDEEPILPPFGIWQIPNVWRRANTKTIVRNTGCLAGRDLSRPGSALNCFCHLAHILPLLTASYSVWVLGKQTQLTSMMTSFSLCQAFINAMPGSASSETNFTYESCLCWSFIMELVITKGYLVSLNFQVWMSTHYSSITSTNSNDRVTEYSLQGLYSNFSALVAMTSIYYTALVSLSSLVIPYNPYEKKWITTQQNENSIIWVVWKRAAKLATIKLKVKNSINEREWKGTQRIHHKCIHFDITMHIKRTLNFILI